MRLGEVRLGLIVLKSKFANLFAKYDIYCLVSGSANTVWYQVRLGLNRKVIILIQGVQTRYDIL